MGLNYSGNGLELTEGAEGLRLESYQDVVGVWTIGYGHTGGVEKGQTITQAQAESLLRLDVEKAEACVNGAVKVVITQDEFDALVDFVFNLGCAAFERSTLLRLLNEGDFNGAASQFLLWVNAGGKRNKGLVARREGEEHLFARGL